MAQTEVTGLFQYLKFAAHPAAPDAAIGLIDGGDVNLDPATRRRLGIGGVELRRGGMTVQEGGAEFYVTDTNQALCAAALRESYPRGALTAYNFEGGADEWTLGHIKCYINTFAFNYARGEGFKATLGWGGEKPYYGTDGGTMTAETNDDFEDWEFAISFGGTEYGITTVGISGNNNGSWDMTGDEGDSGYLRSPRRYVYGAEDLTVAVSAERPLPMGTLNMYMQDQPTDLGLVLTGNNGTNTLTLTLADLTPADPLSFGFVDPNTAAEWTYGFMGSAWGGSLTWGWA